MLIVIDRWRWKVFHRKTLKVLNVLTITGNTPGGGAYRGRGSGAGNAWAAAAQNWAGGGGRTPRGMAGDITPRGAAGETTPAYGGNSRPGGGGYSTTPRYKVIQ